MLPFSSFDFYIVAIFLLIWIFVSKVFLKKAISFSSSLLVASFIFLIVFYPKPLHIVVFIPYSYGIYYLFNSVIKTKNKLLGSLLILLPMIIVKSGIKLQFYPYNLSDWVSFAGLSYISFRIISIYIEAIPGAKPVTFLKYANFLIFTPTFNY